MIDRERRIPVIVITGATRGLGRGLAAALGRQGAAVAIAGPDMGEAVRTAALMRAAMPESRFAGFGCDVRDFGQVRALAADASAALGPIDIWINNAGLALTGQSLDALDTADFAQMIDVNLRGVMHGCKVAARAMAGRGGAIYNLHGAGSDGVPVPGMIGYATTKRAVQFFTTALAAELGAGLVIVAGISPGLVLTEGFFREHARTPEALRPAREATVNILADDVSTVAAWAAEIILANREAGREFAWLDATKLAERRARHPARDVLARYRDADGRIPADAEAR